MRQSPVASNLILLPKSSENQKPAGGTAIDEEDKELEQIEKLRKLAERKKWLDQLHIFQRFREVREEHALKNWQRHSVEWNQVQSALAKKARRDPNDLLMTRLGEYREFVEERELIEEALQMLEFRSLNFWKMGLKIGNDLLGLTLPLPLGGPRECLSFEF